ncbi:MAG: hypothetical protein NC114_09975 [Ruminococcus flavefaciens]|nr:hypothetical protein [Ruminococcus flavefaciens]
MSKTYYDAKGVDYMAVTVMCVPGIFTEDRIDRDSVPDGIYMYEVRDGGSDGIPAEIANSIAVDFLGTLLTKEPLDVPMFLNDEDDWVLDGGVVTLIDFVES